MYSKKINISGLDNVRLLLNVSLDVVTVVVQEKTLNGYEWYEVLFKKFTISSIDSYNFENIIEETLQEFAEKKVIESHIINDINDKNIKEIELPED